MKLILPIAGLIVLAVIAALTGGLSLIPTLPLIVLLLQKLGVVPKGAVAE